MRSHPTMRTSLVALAMVAGFLGVPHPAAGRAPAGSRTGVSLPPARELGGMALDPSGNVVLFGGIQRAGLQALGDTWIWDGTSWTQRHPANAPSPRFSFAMAYDGAHDQVVLFGGTDQYNNVFDDTWVWDGTSWTQRHPAHTPTIGNVGESMAYDAALREVVYVTGEGNRTYAWDGVDWHDITHTPGVPLRWYPELAYDYALGQVVFFAGGEDCFEDICPTNDTLVWSGLAWSHLEGIVKPPVRYLQAMAYDYRRQAVVVFGGYGPYRTLGDTWTWAGRDWGRASPEHSPPPRYAAMMAWDGNDRNLVLFGGEDVAQSFQDTWTWDGTDWTCAGGCS